MWAGESIPGPFFYGVGLACHDDLKVQVLWEPR
jgi:hypothetical protein